MSISRLFAKTATDNSVPESSLLVNHIEAVTSAGQKILSVAGARILSNLSLDADSWMPRFEKALMLSCRLHDIGKANESFQAMVRGNNQKGQQPIRHELISCYLIINNDIVNEWLNINLSDLSSEDQDHIKNTIIGAVAGHHTKMDYKWDKAAPALKQGGYGTSVTLYTSHPDFQSIFPTSDLMCSNMEISLIDGKENSIVEWQDVFNIKNRKWQKHLLKNPDWRQFAAAIKALLMAADAAGSALLPQQISIADWIESTLDDCLQPDDLQSVIDERLGGAMPRPFQAAIGNSEAKITLVEAGCGSGKTIGAYEWAKRHAVGKKLFFCYPTTGTATEGFLGYVAQSPFESELMHSRAAVDLENIVLSGDEESFEKPVRIESLRAWGARIVVCTVDTVLSLVRNNYRGLYSSPAFLSAAFVFDEIHSLDSKMFGAMTAFMKALPGASFLLMSASIEPARIKFLEDNFGKIERISTPVEIESLPRYRIETAIETDAAFKMATEYVRSGKKVLRVVNTVAEAQRWYDNAVSARLRPIIYHSRFKYIDRKRQHRSMIDAFEGNSGVLAIATQVAEMSLDLDADLLITDVAPVPALIQRLGRLNRRITPEAPGSPRVAVVLPVKYPAPYQKEELDSAQIWIDNLMSMNRPLSQSDLSAAFAVITADADESTSFEIEGMEWLDLGLFSFPGAVRSPGISVPVIMEDDLPACRSSRIETEKLTIPLNYQSPWMDGWAVYKNRWIAPSGSIEYDPERGASWLK